MPLREGFDFSDMSDTDYTDIFSDIDTENEIRGIFMKGFARILRIRKGSGLSSKWQKLDFPDLNKMCIIEKDETDVDSEWMYIIRFRPGEMTRDTGVAIDLSMASAEWKDTFGGMYKVYMTEYNPEDPLCRRAKTDTTLYIYSRDDLSGSPGAVCGNVAVMGRPITCDGNNPDSSRNTYTLTSLNGSPRDVSGEFSING